ncbi:MAG: transglutaminase domain-containing protein [Chloroflexi bacterium]|nr:transglutaminase domain-containing protein [Chloroflexota bacterium]
MKTRFTSLDWIALLLLSIALSSMVWGIKSGVRGVDQALFTPIWLFGVIAAYTLGRYGVTTSRSWFAMILIGIGLFTTTSARLHEPLLQIAVSFPRFEMQAITQFVNREPIDFSIIRIHFEEFSHEAEGFLAKIRQVLEGGSTSPSVREALWDIPVLLTAACAGWWASRGKPLFALIPSAGLHAFILYYTNERPLSLQIEMAAWIALIGTIQGHFRFTRATHVQTRTFQESLSSVFLLALALSIGAGFIPVNPINEAIEKSSTEDRLSETLGLERMIPVEFASSSLPRQHLIGMDPSLSESLVFTVQTGEIPATDKELIQIQIPKHYWRWLTYDIYDGYGWATSSVTNRGYSANETIIDLPDFNYKIFHQQVEKIKPEDQRLYWAGLLVQNDQPFRAQWRVSPESLNPGVEPVLRVDMLGALTGQKAYTADSLVPVVTQNYLRATSANYPNQISDMYLALPDIIPDRVLELAELLTSEFDNPYDKARAIESHLRSYPYSLEIGPPPEDREISDYFLFESRTGYCDYYATSMVVLARASGLPARLVVGYANGEYDPVSATYLVRERHAHSWVEVYFSGVGWIEFEPTGNLPPFSRQSVIDMGEPDLDLSQRRESHQRMLESFQRNGRFPAASSHRTLWIATTAIPLFFSVYLHRRGWTILDQSIYRIYHHLRALGTWIYADPPLHETPSRFCEEILKKLPSNSPLINIARSELKYLIGLYVLESYGPSPISPQELKRANKTWRRLFWRLTRIRLVQFFQSAG